ncbi:isocitrate/isopropylmalate dehydrogenase family protein [Candidatus Woesearchaeota archaeon]|jgi:isopropylmalate/isohomocitrate dehydrogenase-like protein|nr:isocitrate/isopropylmalate dehydrogenase family protein [archaeon]MBT5023473.1 isocitrate/isopropylmalate dehydrogenase family protein [Candidatus Woesearchaeota archaeon]MBT4022584.1 isocitrate/isopropylmalate dehydrogenase family protein [archaeon]MBT4272024.1 isocitrate/isopropylmalate dehydrogenase family protein [archaeon]MBT4461121.1 isocitrate/isopropylmalate dehydrogenase family protein [archaeon]
MSYKICILPGDGIGPEVVENTINLLKTLPIDLEFIYGDIGYDCYVKTGNSLPNETLEKVKNSDATLFGAVTTPPNIPNYSSPILRLRQHFELYANVRPCKSIPNKISRPGINLIMVRENTEGLYSRSERVEDEGNRAITEMIITRKGSERVIRYAFNIAKKNNMKKVTVVHKANVLRETTGLFLRVAQEVAKEFPQIVMEDMIVDNCAMQLIKKPEQFEVIVTTNMFGDILSDEASALIGGLGLANSGNIGENYGVFEPVHGSAPKYVGLNKANPAATFLAAKLMLEYLGENRYAKLIEKAMLKAIKNNQTTKDLGGSLNSIEFTNVVINNLKEML